MGAAVDGAVGAADWPDTRGRDFVGGLVIYPGAARFLAFLVVILAVSLAPKEKNLLVRLLIYSLCYILASAILIQMGGMPQ